ncbi:MAG: preprotein translocase subunit SecE [Actinomycetota bacterium]
MAANRKSGSKSAPSGKPRARSGGASKPPESESRSTRKTPSGTKAAAAAAKEGRKGSVAAKGGRAAKGAAKEPEAQTPPDGQGMNREMKRMMKKREGAADRLRKPPTVSGKTRTKPRDFLKEVRGELARVAWPTRQEVITYTSVVLVTVAFFMTVIYAIDYVALNGVLFLIERGGR